MNSLDNFARNLQGAHSRFVTSAMQVILELAWEYAGKLDAALGVIPSTNTMGKSAQLWQWVTKTSSVNPAEQCNVNGNTDIGYGAGIYTTKTLPKYPAHEHCKCSIRSIEEATQPENTNSPKWKVIINKDQVIFRNDSDEYIKKKEGTADQIKNQKVEQVGIDPTDFDSPIIKEFESVVDAQIKELGDKIFGAL